MGNTIVLSRGLIDVLPSESAIALVLAHQLAHNALAGVYKLPVAIGGLHPRLRVTGWPQVAQT